MRSSPRRPPLFQPRTDQFVPAVPNELRALIGDGGHYATDRKIEIPAEVMRRVRTDLRRSESYAGFQQVHPAAGLTYHRNTFGQCTQQAPGVVEYFCGCCKFSNPEAVLDNVISRYFVLFYSMDLYTGVSVSQLYPVHTLHSLEDRQTVQEFLDGTYSWVDLVARHYSRLHWRAVACERERMLQEWTTFISYINSLPSNSCLLMNEEKRADTLLQLLPGIPPQAPDGAFLFQREWKEQLTKAVLGQVEGYFGEAGIPLQKSPPFPFQLCHIVDSWLLHGFLEPVTPEDMFIADAILKPEKQRRMVNACRNYYGGEETLELIMDRTTLTLADFHQPTESWKPMQSEFEVGRKVLESQTMHTFWTFYRGGDLNIQYQRFFVCPEFFAQEVLAALLVEHRFEEMCEVMFTWIRTEQLQTTNYNDQTFALAIECTAANMPSRTDIYHRIFSEQCISDSTLIRRELPTEDNAFSAGYFVILATGEEGHRDNMHW